MGQSIHFQRMMSWYSALSWGSRVRGSCSCRSNRRGSGMYTTFFLAAFSIFTPNATFSAFSQNFSLTLRSDFSTLEQRSVEKAKIPPATNGQLQYLLPSIISAGQGNDLPNSKSEFREAEQATLDSPASEKTLLRMSNSWKPSNRSSSLRKMATWLWKQQDLPKRKSLRQPGLGLPTILIFYLSREFSLRYLKTSVLSDSSLKQIRLYWVQSCCRIDLIISMPPPLLCETTTHMLFYGVAFSLYFFPTSYFCLSAQFSSFFSFARPRATSRDSGVTARSSMREYVSAMWRAGSCCSA